MDLASLLTTKVTTASKFAERLSDAPGIISVVSQDELRRFGAITLREILDRVPGLTGTTAYFTDRSLVAVRGDQTGIDGGHILILINGRPTREVMEGGIISDLLESFPVNALESIEVIKGPGSVLYGSNAFSGVVNLITKKGATNGAGITALGGAAGARALSGQASFDRGGLSIFAAAQFHQKPDWSTPYLLRDSSGNDPLASTALVQNINITDSSVGTYLGATYKGWSFMSSFTQWENASFVRGIVGEPRWRRGFADLGYAFTPSHNWDMNFNLTYTRTTFFVTAAPDIRRDSNEAILEWTNILRLGAKDELTFGALFNHLQGRETYFGIDPSLVIGQGGWSGGTGYAQLNHQLLNSLKLVGGLQVNKVGGVALNAVPRGGIIWTPAPRFSVKALYSQAFRAPSIDETLLNHPGLAGNPNLVPEKVSTVDFGVSYQSNRVQAGISVFHSKQSNSIVIETVTPRWQYVNLGETTFRGAEFEGKYYLQKNFYLLGSVLYQTNENAAGQKNVTPIPNLGAKGGISFQARHGLTASVFDVYGGSISGYSSTVNPMPQAQHLLSAHVRYDVSKYLRATSKASVALIAYGDDLTNKQVWLPDWGDNTGDTIPAQRGRTVYFGIEIAAGKN